MFYSFQNRAWGVVILCVAALGDPDVAQSRTFIFTSTTSIIGAADSIITVAPAPPTTALSNWALSTWTEPPNTLPWSYSIPRSIDTGVFHPSYTSTSSIPSTSTYRETGNTDTHQWGVLQPPPPKTEVPSFDSTLPASTSLFLNLPSTFAPNSTGAWSNTTYSSRTSLSVTPAITSMPAPSCQPGRKGCQTNTNTEKTEKTGLPEGTAICEEGMKGCDTNTNTEKTEYTEQPTKTDSEFHPTGTTTCDITLDHNDPGTVWSVLPNTETTTITITAGSNYSTSFSTIPEFTPPVYCTPIAIIFTIGTHTTTSSGVTFAATQTNPGWAAPTPTTSITSSKNPVTAFTTFTPASFPGGPKTDKISETGNTDTHTWGPLQPPPPKTITDDTGSQTAQSQVTSPPVRPTTTKVGTIPVIVGPTQVIIGSSTVKPGPSTTKITQGGQTFTVNPSQVIGPGVTVSIPTVKGGIFMPTPTPTVIAGVPVQLGPTSVIIGGSTFSIGPGASQTTVVVNGQTISIGPGGLGFAQTTVAPPAPTKVIIIDGELISAIGSSMAIIGGSTFFFDPSSSPKAQVFNGETITIGPSGISFGTTTIGGSGNPSGTQLGTVGEVSITEIGSSVAVIGGTTFIVGPGAIPTTAVVDGKTITAGPDGLDIGGTTVSFPLNGDSTQVVTAGGITISEIGSTLVDIGGTIFTIGPGAKTTTDVYNGQTISIGPDGIGFRTTTITAESGPTLSPSATQTGKKNGAGALKPLHGVLGLCILAGVAYNI